MQNFSIAMLCYYGWIQGPELPYKQNMLTGNILKFSGC